MSFQIYDPFVELGISPDASIPEAKKAAYNLLKCHHPDKSGVDSDKAKRIIEAKKILTNIKYRKHFEIFNLIDAWDSYREELEQDNIEIVDLVSDDESDFNYDFRIQPYLHKRKSKCAITKRRVIGSSVKIRKQKRPTLQKCSSVWCMAELANCVSLAFEFDINGTMLTKLEANHFNLWGNPFKTTAHHEPQGHVGIAKQIVNFRRKYTQGKCRTASEIRNLHEIYQDHASNINQSTQSESEWNAEKNIKSANENNIGTDGVNEPNKTSENAPKSTSEYEKIEELLQENIRILKKYFRWNKKQNKLREQRASQTSNLIQNKKCTNAHITGSDNPKGIHTCDICGKSYNQRSSLSRHKHSHGPSGGYHCKCRYCNKLFKTPSNRSTHEKYHKKKKDKPLHTVT